MSKEMKKAYVRRGDSAADIWTRLGARFADTSRASLKFREDKYKNNLKGSSQMREWQESLDEDFDAIIDAGGILRDEDRLEVLMDNVGPDYSHYYTEAWDAGLAMGKQLTYANACQALISAELKMKRNKERHATSSRQVNSANTVSCYVCLKNHVHTDCPKKPTNVYKYCLKCKTSSHFSKFCHQVNGGVPKLKSVNTVDAEMSTDEEKEDESQEKLVKYMYSFSLAPATFSTFSFGEEVDYMCFEDKEEEENPSTVIFLEVVVVMMTSRRIPMAIMMTSTIVFQRKLRSL